MAFMAIPSESGWRDLPISVAYSNENQSKFFEPESRAAASGMLTAQNACFSQ